MIESCGQALTTPHVGTPDIVEVRSAKPRKVYHHGSAQPQEAMADVRNKFGSEDERREMTRRRDGRVAPTAAFLSAAVFRSTSTFDFG